MKHRSGQCGKAVSWIHKASSVTGIAIRNGADFVAEIAVKIEGRRNVVDGETAQ